MWFGTRLLMMNHYDFILVTCPASFLKYPSYQFEGIRPLLVFSLILGVGGEEAERAQRLQQQECLLELSCCFCGPQKKRAQCEVLFEWVTSFNPNSYPSCFIKEEIEAWWR
jgi:hypothetical protein